MIHLESASSSNPGRQRENNQDHVWAQVFQPKDAEPVGLFIVCDGVGGHQGGQYASHWAVETVKSDFSNLITSNDPRKTLLLSKEELEDDESADEVTRVSDTRRLEEMVCKSIEHANQVVNDFALQHPTEAGDAGTTITLAVVLGNRAVIANVGDSRTYLLRDGELRQITNDHSLVAGLVASGQLQPEDVFSHPQRNLIFRSLGQKNEIQIDTFAELLSPGDYLLLCSDGLWEMVQENREIVSLILESDNLQKACDSLIAAANAAGGADNIGVVLARLG